MGDLERRIGASIAKRRRQKGLEQAELARLASQTLGKPIGVNQLSRWENGKALIRLDALLAVAEVLETKIDQLITGEESFFDSVVAELDDRFAKRIARIEKQLGI